jgi:DNA-binding transcriptional regulator YiaG
MTTKTKFKSDAFEAIRNAARGLHRAGAIDKATMREFDKSCLAVPTEISAADIKRIREPALVSQPVFARYPKTSGLSLASLAKLCSMPAVSCWRSAALSRPRSSTAPLRANDWAASGGH